MGIEELAAVGDANEQGTTTTGWGGGQLYSPLLILRGVLCLSIVVVWWNALFDVGVTDVATDEPTEVSQQSSSVQGE